MYSRNFFEHVYASIQLIGTLGPSIVEPQKVDGDRTIGSRRARSGGSVEIGPRYRGKKEGAEARVFRLKCAGQVGGGGR